MPSYCAAILGGIWWPYGAVCSTEREYQAESDEAAILAAQTTEAGDFSSVIDVRVLRYSNVDGRFSEEVKDWDSEENAYQYWDTVFPGEEEDSA